MSLDVIVVCGSGILGLLVMVLFAIRHRKELWKEYWH
jgi:hypothetical protein